MSTDLNAKLAAVNNKLATLESLINDQNAGTKGSGVTVRFKKAALNKIFEFQAKSETMDKAVDALREDIRVGLGVLILHIRSWWGGCERLKPSLLR